MKNLTSVCLLIIMTSIVAHGQFRTEGERDLEAKLREVEVQTRTPEEICKDLAGKSISTVDADMNSGVKAFLGNISVAGNNLFCSVRISNASNISYDVDFIRFYIRDIKTPKRTVIQEREILPICSYGPQRVVGETAEFVFALPKFPISKDKALFVEIYEKEANRQLYLIAKNRDIVNAKIVQE